MSKQEQTNAAVQLLTELDGGAFINRLADVVREVAGGVHRTDKAGEVSVKLAVKPNKNTNQTGCGTKVDVASQLKFVKPTAIGKASEEGTTVTPMWINKDLSVTVLAKSQDDMFAGESKVTAINQS